MVLLAMEMWPTMSSTIDCPYCEHEHDATGCHETDESNHECEGCGKEFNVLIEYDPTYSTSKIPCKDDVPHEWGDWRPWHDYQAGHSKEIRGASCMNCDKVRVESREKKI